MQEIEEFSVPEFLDGTTPEEIHQRMMNALPSDIDDMPGGFPYDFTKPTALVASQLLNFHLVRALMLMFPMWAWGEWLDYHAQMCGLSRRPAEYASGKLLVNGIDNTVIPAGSQFAVPATENSAAIFFKTTEEAIIHDGRAEIPIIAEEPGTQGNVSANSITLMGKTLKGITKISNLAAVTGGTSEENDESLRERIMEANQEQVSYVGNDSDYIRWGKEVNGVGGVAVVPEWNGPGTVKVVVVDANGEPANEALIKNVYHHIVSPDDRLARLAPIGATVTVTAPELIELVFVAVVVTDENYDLQDIKENFRQNMMIYFEEAKTEDMLIYTKMAAILSNTVGVSDYSQFKVNGKTENIAIGETLYPKVAAMNFTEGG